LYKNRKQTTQKEKQYSKQYKNNAESQNTQHRKQKYKTKKTNIKWILENVSRVIRK